MHKRILPSAPHTDIGHNSRGFRFHEQWWIERGKQSQWMCSTMNIPERRDSLPPNIILILTLNTSSHCFSISAHCKPFPVHKYKWWLNGFYEFIRMYSLLKNTIYWFLWFLPFFFFCINGIIIYKFNRTKGVKCINERKKLKSFN